MCMGGCAGSKAGKSNTSYVPKSVKGSSVVNKGSYTPKGTPQVSTSFGKPQVKISFSGKK